MYIFVADLWSATIFGEKEFQPLRMQRLNVFYNYL